MIKLNVRIPFRKFIPYKILAFIQSHIYSVRRSASDRICRIGSPPTPWRAMWIRHHPDNYIYIYILYTGMSSADTIGAHTSGDLEGVHSSWWWTAVRTLLRSHQSWRANFIMCTIIIGLRECAWAARWKEITFSYSVPRIDSVIENIVID